MAHGPDSGPSATLAPPAGPGAALVVPAEPARPAEVGWNGGRGSDELARRRPVPALGALLARYRFTLLVLALLLAAWEVVGRLPASNGVFPPLSRTLQQLWTDRSLYQGNAGVTLRNAAWGFLAGNAVAIALAVLFHLSPVLGRLGRGVLLSLYCAPLMVMAPIIGVSFGGDVPKIVLAALAVTFPTFVATTVGLSSTDRTLGDVVRGVGGSSWSVLRKVRLRAALPDTLAGLRVAAPSAILGSMLGEFLGGSRGLGILLVATLPQAFPERLWGVGLVATAVAAASYALFAAIGAFVSAHQRSPEVGTGGLAPVARTGPLASVGWTAASIAVVLGAWVGYIEAVGLPPTFAKGPGDVWAYLVTGAAADEHRAMFTDALATTLPRAGLGLLCGLGLAFALAVALSLSPAAASALMPVALVSQSMPLVALTPLIVVTLGRGSVAVLAITTSVTFFPSFVTISQGLRATPRGAIDVLAAYDAPRTAVLWKVAAPGAVPHLLAAMRLAIPRAMLGVIIAEYLALGTGLGGLILRARGRLEFTLLWSTAAVVTALSVLVYALVALLERACRRRFGSST